MLRQKRLCSLGDGMRLGIIDNNINSLIVYGEPDCKAVRVCECDPMTGVSGNMDVISRLEVDDLAGVGEAQLAFALENDDPLVRRLVVIPVGRRGVSH